MTDRKKGILRANAMRKTKVESAIFFVECLNNFSKIFELMSVLGVTDEEEFAQFDVVQDFLKLPHSPTNFNGSINSYRAKLVLKILGKNVNPMHLKKFSQNEQGEKTIQDRQRCDYIFSMIENNKAHYKHVMQSFEDCFVEQLRRKWLEEDRASMDLNSSSSSSQRFVPDDQAKSLRDEFNDLISKRLSSNQSNLPDSPDSIETNTKDRSLKNVTFDERSLNTYFTNETTMPSKIESFTDQSLKSHDAKTLLEPNHEEPIPLTVEDASLKQLASSAESNLQPVPDLESESITSLDTHNVVNEVTDETALINEQPQKKSILQENIELSKKKDPSLAKLFDINSWDMSHSDSANMIISTSSDSVEETTIEQTESSNLNVKPDASNEIAPDLQTDSNTLNSSDSLSNLTTQEHSSTVLNTKLETPHSTTDSSTADEIPQSLTMQERIKLIKEKDPSINKLFDVKSWF